MHSQKRAAYLLTGEYVSQLGYGKTMQDPAYFMLNLTFSEQR